jgi:hypothetical protein
MLCNMFDKLRCVHLTLIHNYAYTHVIACRVLVQLPQFKIAGSADILDSVLLDNGAIPKDLVIIGVTGTYKQILTSKVATSTDASTGKLTYTV